MTATADQVTIEMALGPDGLPVGAAATTRVAAPPSAVFALLRAIERYPGHVPMIHRASRDGGRADVQLRFRVALFTARFAFTAAVTEEPDRRLELVWLSGEPRELRIRHDLEPLDGGAATRLTSYIGFDIRSLGWLVKFFLRHHPEIQFGVFAGTASALQHSLKRALGSPHLAHIA